MMIDLTEQEREILLDAVNDSMQPGKHCQSDETLRVLRGIRAKLAAGTAPSISPSEQR